MRSPFFYLLQWQHASPILLAHVLFKKPLQITKILKMKKLLLSEIIVAASQHVQDQRSWAQVVKTGQEECQNLLLEHTWVGKMPPSYLSVLSLGWHCRIKAQLSHFLNASTPKAFKDLKKIKCLCCGYGQIRRDKKINADCPFKINIISSCLTIFWLSCRSPKQGVAGHSWHCVPCAPATAQPFCLSCSWKLTLGVSSCCTWRAQLGKGDKQIEKQHSIAFFFPPALSVISQGGT